ncbi:MAG TPA: hypothetical protein VJI15_03390 [Candidatus Nanoarchaeia archaeon]|nr:hypothetical protein [Candidatus Nanoarchaeia archaeon]
MKNYVKIILLSFLVLIVIGGSKVIYDAFIWPHYPLGDSCQVDTDCVCRSNALDGCGETGDFWKCVENRCDVANVYSLR